MTGAAAGGAGEAAAPGSAGRGGRVSRGRVVVVLLVLGALGFVLSSVPWASAPVVTVLADRQVSVSGGQAAPATTAASLAVLAAALAVAIGGRWVARLCAVALLVLGALLTASALGFLLDPRPPLLAAAADVGGVREIAGEPAPTAWPYLAVGLGLVVAAAAFLPLRVSTTAPTRRFERAAAPPAAEPDRRGAQDQRIRAMDDWDALGRGEDPSATEHG